MLIYPDEMQAIKKHPYFAGFESDSDIKWLLQCCEANISSAAAGEVIAKAGEELRYLPIVIEGSVEKEAAPVREWAQIESQSGLSHTIIAVVPPQDIIAKEDCRVLNMKVMRALTPCGRHCSFHMDFVEKL